MDSYAGHSQPPVDMREAGRRGRGLVAEYLNSWHEVVQHRLSIASKSANFHVVPWREQEVLRCPPCRFLGTSGRLRWVRIMKGV